MRNILAVLIALTGIGYTADAQSEPAKLSYGKVLEVTEVMGYDYLKVDENGTQRWVAIAKAPVKAGDRIGYDTKTIMKDFQSKQLNRTFKEIVFANEVYLSEKPKQLASLKDAVILQKNESKVELIDMDFMEKPYYTVEELHRFRKHLEGKRVAVKAKVYKVAQGIMKKDWVHLGDGTGKESDMTDDIVFTTPHTTLQAGDSVIAHGKIVTDKDFGFGYFYEVLGEEAEFEPLN